MKLKKLLLIALTVSIFSMSIAPKAHAQLSAGGGIAGQFDYIRGVFKEVGKVFVPEWRSPNNYMEHWILFPDYVYPGEKNPSVDLSVTPDENIKYDNVSDFLKENFCEGCTYIRVESTEYTGDEVKQFME